MRGRTRTRTPAGGRNSRARAGAGSGDANRSRRTTTAGRRAGAVPAGSRPTPGTTRPARRARHFRKRQPKSNGSAATRGRRQRGARTRGLIPLRPLRAASARCRAVRPASGGSLRPSIPLSPASPPGAKWKGPARNEVRSVSPLPASGSRPGTPRQTAPGRGFRVREARLDFAPEPFDTAQSANLAPPGCRAPGSRTGTRFAPPAGGREGPVARTPDRPAPFFSNRPVTPGTRDSRRRPFRRLLPGAARSPSSLRPVRGAGRPPASSGGRGCSSGRSYPSGLGRVWRFGETMTDIRPYLPSPPRPDPVAPAVAAGRRP